MTQTITGIVEKVNDQNSPAGAPRKWTKKAFNVNGEWYSNFITVENKAMVESIKEGDAVSIEFETKGSYKNWLKLEVIAKNEPTKASAVVPVPYNVHDKDYRITYLAARRDAIEFVKAAIQLDMVSLGSKKNEKVDIFYELVKEYAVKFAEDAYVPREENVIPVGTESAKETTNVE